MGKLYDSTKFHSSYNSISQTPPNYTIKDYWLKTTQDKVDADWDYRPNRVLIEQENNFGKETYSPLEVVIQSIKNDTGTVISDDWRRLVFRDTRYECPLGLKFRFSYNFNIDEDDKDKSVWLASNRNSANATGSVVIVRCNGTLGSTYTDTQGVTHYHYEPVVQTKDLKSVSLFYNQTAVGQQSDLIAIVQHNNYTKNYYVNQRFIVGYDQVYRIEGMSKFASLKTYDPTDLGTIILYLSIVETSEYDNFETRIAYNQKEKTIIDTEDQTDNYHLKLTLPTEIPTILTSTPTEFQVKLYNGTTEVTGTPVITKFELMNASEPPTAIDVAVMNKYLSITADGATVTTGQIDNTDKFTLSRLRFYPAGNLIITCSAQITAETSVKMSFNLSLRGA